VAEEEKVRNENKRGSIVPEHARYLAGTLRRIGEVLEASEAGHVLEGVVVEGELLAGADEELGVRSEPPSGCIDRDGGDVDTRYANSPFGCEAQKLAPAAGHVE
jgi:hypothetical protein